MSLVSIITPIYKAEKYLQKCLDSIIAQTYTNWEAILVDDGSPDNSGAICDEYAAKDKRFKVIRQENKGVVNARNTAIAIAQGEYLAFVDSDDTIEPTMLEEMFTIAEKEKSDIVYCNIKAILPNGIRNINIVSVNNGKDAIKNLLLEKLQGWLWNKFIKKTFWDKCSIVTDDDAVIMEDTYILIQLFARNPRIKSINSYLYNYNRTNEGAATAINNDVTIKSQKNIDNIYNWLIKEELFNQYKEEFAHMAMTLKFALLRKDINQAINCYPFAHKKFSNFRFSFIVSAFYWLLFNTGGVGKSLFKLYFRYK
jgi:glycosyltransferase involved in cell wall biosynthesis